MKLLSTSFKRNGFAFEQVLRAGHWAIYRKTKGNWAGYEVIRVLRHNGRIIGGKTIEPSEYYPSSENWGTLGFSCPDMASAYVRYHKSLSNGGTYSEPALF